MVRHVLPAAGLLANRGLARRSLTPGESSRRLGLAVLLVALLIFFGLRYSNFLTSSNLLTIMLNVSAIGIAAMGAGALLITGNVDLSIGGEFALISVVVGFCERGIPNAAIGVVVGLLLGAGLGLINGVLVRKLSISPIIVTLGTMSVYSGTAFAVTNGVDVFNFNNMFMQLGTAQVGAVPVEIIVAAVIVIAGGYILLRTVPGLHAYAIGGNAEAARYNGVHIDRIIVSLYVIMGFLMGVVSVLETARLGSATANIGATLALDALTAVLLGGVSFLGGSGHPLGIVLGVLTIGVINAGLIFAELADWYQNIAKGSLLLLALAADQFAVHRRARSVSSAGRAEAAPQPAGWAGDGPATLTLESETFRAGKTSRDAPIVFACGHLSKSYGALNAVQDVSFEVRAGEVVCLVGDNGAGKSTVVKMISGAIPPDQGTILVDGRQVARMHSIADGRRAGIQCVFQDLAVCANLGIAHNLILGDEPRRRAFGLIPVRDDLEAARRAKERLARLGIYLEDFGRPVRWLSGGQRQSVAVARVLQTGARLVVLDEPTAALGINQTRNVLAMVRTVADEGAGVILITHDIETVFTVGDRAVVLRQGRKVHDGPLDRLRKTDLVHLMAGFALTGAGVEDGG